MKNFHVSMLLMLLCSVPVFASEPSDVEKRLTVVENGVQNLAKTCESCSNKVTAMQGELENVDLEQVKNLAKNVGELQTAVEELIKEQNKPNVVTRAIKGAGEAAMAPVNYAKGFLPSKTLITDCGLDTGAYILASNFSLVNRSAKAERLMQRVFADQADFAVYSAIAQGLSQGYQVFSDQQSKKSAKVKAVAVAVAVAKDLAENAIVAKTKEFAVNRVIKPVAEKYGIELPANKLCNAVIDGLSLIILRRTTEAAGNFVGAKWNSMNFSGRNP